MVRARETGEQNYVTKNSVGFHNHVYPCFNYGLLCYLQKLLSSSTCFFTLFTFVCFGGGVVSFVSEVPSSNSSSNI